MNLNLQSVKQAIDRQYQVEKLHPTEQFEPFIACLDDCWYYIEKAQKSDIPLETVRTQFGELLQFFFADCEIMPRIYQGENIITNIQLPHKHTPSVLIRLIHPNAGQDLITPKRLNKTVFKELILAFLQEVLVVENKDLKSVVLTNFEKWFVFDVAVFKAVFLSNQKLVQAFIEWQTNLTAPTYEKLVSVLTELIKQSEATLQVTCFNLMDYQKIVQKDLKSEEKETRESAKIELANLYKSFTIQHLASDEAGSVNRALNATFFNELLHLLGLDRIKQKGQMTIERANVRQAGSLLENIMNRLIATEALQGFPLSYRYGETEQEQLWNIANALMTTWVSRLIFLKVLEGLLVIFHADDEDRDVLRFLNTGGIKDFQALNELFFDVIAMSLKSRALDFFKNYQRIPYINSSLFELTTLEKQTLSIADLDDNAPIAVVENSVLSDTHELTTFSYLLQFFEAYDFGVEQAESIIHTTQKTYISLQQIGVVLEQLNARKSGFSFTPNDVVQQLARKTIRTTVVAKFNIQFEQDFQDFETLRDYILEQSAETDWIEPLNGLINSLRICDPAVGSGRFLVAALRELLVLKSDLQVLCDENNQPLNHIQLLSESDELLILNEDGTPFQYKIDFSSGVRRLSPTAQHVQQTIFNEKRQLIEHGLFGVDINENAVQLCQLRLWLELIQHIYYLPRRNTQLATLPNIEINIKKGNALIARFGLTENLNEVFRKSYFSVEQYKNTVAQYKSTQQLTEKQQLAEYIEDIKLEFSTSLTKKDRGKLSKARGQYEKLKTYIEHNQAFGFLPTKEEQQTLETLQKRFVTLQAEQQQVLDSNIYDDAFEWRFEFPEVLDEEGNFKGFDVILCLPPHQKIPTDKPTRLVYKSKYSVYSSQILLYIIYFELILNLLKTKGVATLLTSNKFEQAQYGLKLRNMLTHHHILQRTENPTVYPSKNLQLVTFRKS